MAKRHIHIHYHDATNHLGETEYETYKKWKEACRRANPSVRFEGNEDICNARPGVGEWDGEKGVVYAKGTSDAIAEVTAAIAKATSVAHLKDLLSRIPGLSRSEVSAALAQFANKTKDSPEIYKGYTIIGKPFVPGGAKYAVKRTGSQIEEEGYSNSVAEAKKKIDELVKTKDASNYSDVVRQQLQAINQDLTEAARKMDRLTAAWSGSDAGLNELDKLINAARRKCFELR